MKEAQECRLFEGCSLAFGVFDGFHRGHQFLIGETIEHARREMTHSAILTFDKDPDEVFNKEGFKKLCSNEERIRLLSESGVDAVVLLPFNEWLSRFDPLSFMEYAFQQCYPESIHVGVDFRYGYKGAGTVDDLRFWADRTGTAIYPYNLFFFRGSPVTSTRVRDFLEVGSVEAAALLMNRRHGFSGTVVSGRQQGREMGFRTANLEIPAWQCLPCEGVYAGYAIVDGKGFKAAISMGVSPTFEDAVAQCEVHILDFEGDLYGQEIAVRLVRRLRPMEKFDSVDELIDTVTSDIQWCRDNL